MSRIEFWLGVMVIAGAIVLHGGLPLYSAVIAEGAVVNVDRWTGRAISLDYRGDCESMQRVEQVIVR
jgi:hypothetical protein